jgi:hypothetical protein
VSSLVGACSQNSPASVPVYAAPSTYPVLELQDEWADDEHHGIPGYFVTHKGLNGMLAGFELKLGEVHAELAGEKAAHKVTTRAFDAMAKSIKPLETMARWGVPIGIGIGFSVAAIFAGIVAAILKSLPAQFVQAAQ